MTNCRALHSFDSIREIKWRFFLLTVQRGLMNENRKNKLPEVLQKIVKNILFLEK